ncbi:hypothetical protein RvY_18521 [Ramazzottius varieornatus]|uniref:G-protein coupled receptors family 1 profile domain-containing protein n=1 Tax=Ramazzottius varieornatus TaxID=947166 RepID=A0A1D1W628_RAMVA|nr:hypothetical protein RvY_18521 [Ramazzottius varieornatus]
MNNTTGCMFRSNDSSVPCTDVHNTNSNLLIQIGDPQETIRAFLTIPIALIGSLGSCGSLWSIWHDSLHQKTTANLMFVNMSIATLFLCGIHNSMAIYTILTPFENDIFRYPQNDGLCQFESFFYWVCLCACSNSHVVTALDRVHSVYRLGHRKNSSWFLVGVSWVLPVVISAFPLFHLGGVYGFADAARRCAFVKMDSKAYRVAYKFISGIIPLLLMVPCYMAVFHKVYLSQRRVQQYPVQGRKP